MLNYLKIADYMGKYWRLVAFDFYELQYHDIFVILNKIENNLDMGYISK